MEQIKGIFVNAKIAKTAPKTYEEMSAIEKAKADMDFMRHKGGFGYKQAKRHYEKLLRREKQNGRSTPTD